MPLTNAQLQKRHRDRIKEKLARLERYEWALRSILTLDTRDVHVGYDNGSGGGNYVYEDYISALDAFAIIRNALADQ